MCALMVPSLQSDQDWLRPCPPATASAASLKGYNCTAQPQPQPATVHQASVWDELLEKGVVLCIAGRTWSRSQKLAMLSKIGSNLQKIRYQRILLTHQSQFQIQYRDWAIKTEITAPLSKLIGYILWTMTCSHRRYSGVFADYDLLRIFIAITW